MQIIRKISCVSKQNKTTSRNNKGTSWIKKQRNEKKKQEPKREIKKKLWANIIPKTPELQGKLYFQYKQKETNKTKKKKQRRRRKRTKKNRTITTLRPLQHLGKKKTNKHKEFWWDTPWCASRLSRGHVPSVPWYVPSVPGTFCPFSIDLHIDQAQMSQVSLGRPDFVSGTPPGHPDCQIPLCDISLLVFFSP